MSQPQVWELRYGTSMSTTNSTAGKQPKCERCGEPHGTNKVCWECHNYPAAPRGKRGAERAALEQIYALSGNDSITMMIRVKDIARVALSQRHGERQFVNCPSCNHFFEAIASHGDSSELLNALIVPAIGDKSLRLCGDSYRWMAERAMEHSDGSDYLTATAKQLEQIGAAIDKLGDSAAEVLREIEREGEEFLTSKRGDSADVAEQVRASAQDEITAAEKAIQSEGRSDSAELP